MPQSIGVVSIASWTPLPVVGDDFQGIGEDVAAGQQPRHQALKCYSFP
jgi:hypothetical protein